MHYFFSFGGGVNSVAILALIIKGELKYENLHITFADTGAEKPQTYNYIDYLNKFILPQDMKINTVKSKEGSLYDYCFNKHILPQRYHRWCTDRWKRVPLNHYRESIIGESEDFKFIIGIDAGESGRAKRWSADEHATFPLVELGIDRKGCIKLIQSMGWPVPVKSGCWFCPFSKMTEFKELKLCEPELFDKLVVLEKNVLDKLKDFKDKGWFDPKRPINKAITHRFPETVEGQETLCCFCSK